MCLGKPICTPHCLRSYPSVAFETVLVLVWLVVAISHPFSGDCRVQRIGRCHERLCVESNGKRWLSLDLKNTRKRLFTNRSNTEICLQTSSCKDLFADQNFTLTSVLAPVWEFVQKFLCKRELKQGALCKWELILLRTNSCKGPFSREEFYTNSLLWAIICVEISSHTGILHLQPLFMDRNSCKDLFTDRFYAPPIHGQELMLRSLHTPKVYF